MQLSKSTSPEKGRGRIILLTSSGSTKISSRQTNAVVLWGTVRASKSRIQLKVACRLSKTKQQSLWGCTEQITTKMAIWQRCGCGGRKQKQVPRLSCIRMGHLACPKIPIIESNQQSSPVHCKPPHELTGSLM